MTLCPYIFAWLVKVFYKINQIKTKSLNLCLALFIDDLSEMTKRNLQITIQESFFEGEFEDSTLDFDLEFRVLFLKISRLVVHKFSTFLLSAD